MDLNKKFIPIQPNQFVVWAMAVKNTAEGGIKSKKRRPFEYFHDFLGNSNIFLHEG